MSANQKELTAQEKEELISLLEDRFEKNSHRHEGLTWADVVSKLEKSPEKLWSLYEMERTGGEPDVVGYEKDRDAFVFYDCCKESPKGRRSVCYDKAALESRKKYKPETSAADLALSMGVDMLDEHQYRRLQEIEPVDQKTSSWVRTPEDIRSLGGALFCDRRFGHVFLYHNGAESYYAARGFRSFLKV